MDLLNKPPDPTNALVALTVCAGSAGALAAGTSGALVGVAILSGFSALALLGRLGQIDREQKLLALAFEKRMYEDQYASRGPGLTTDEI